MKRATVLTLLLCAALMRGAQAQPSPAAPTAPATPPASAAPATPPAPGALAAPPPAVPGEAPVAAPPATAREDIALPPADLEIEGLDVQAGGLTMDETARRSIAASSDVKAKQAELAQANAKISQTIYQFWPQLTLRAGYTRLSPASANLEGGAILGAQNAGAITTNADGDVVDSMGQPVGATVFAIAQLKNNYSLSASLVIPLSDYVLRLANAADSAEAGRESAHLAEEATKLRVDTDARVLYLNWLRAHGQISIAKKALDRNRARLEDARVALSVGTATNADFLRLEALVANSEQALQQAESLRNLTEATMVIMMADSGVKPYVVGEGVPNISLPPLDRASALKATQVALSRRLELKAIDASQKALQSGESATRAGALPRIDAVGDITYANPNQRYFPPQQEWNATWSVGVTATWNIADTFLNGARADELEAQVGGVRAQRIGMTAAIAHEVVSAGVDVGNAQSALKTSEVALRAAEEAYRVTTDLYRVGRATTTDLIAAETELLGAKLGNTNARIDLAIAVLRFRHATGEDVASR
jgi:outer membrane protein TolC